MDTLAIGMIAFVAMFVIGHALDCWRDVRLAEARAKFGGEQPEQDES